MTDFLVAQSREGPPAYPDGTTNYYDALAKVEEKLAVRYVAEREAEHQHQLQPLPTPQTIYSTREKNRKLKQAENLCLVRAYQTLPTWKERVEYLKEHGYEYRCKTAKGLYDKLQGKIKDLIDTGEWEKLVKGVEK